MNRLSVEERERVVSLITYTPEVRAKIDAATKVNFFGNFLTIDPAYVSTPEGISQQLDKFVLPQGLLYFVDSDLQMQRIAVSISPRDVKGYDGISQS